MPYRFSKSESVTAGVRRISREQLDDAIAHLTARQGSVETHVHEARKSIKKLRGVLRLIRPVFAGYEAENVTYRDVGRALSQWRESSVARKAVDRFLQQARGTPSERRWARLQQILEHADPAAVPDIASLHRRTGELVAVLRRATDRISAWELPEDPFALIGRGLHATHKRVCRYYKRVRKTDDPRLSHQWRKHVKYHWYHMRLLEAAWPERPSNYRQTLAALAECLGAEHDMVDLLDRVAGLDEDALPGRERAALRGDIERERARLRGESIRLGEFVTTPFARHQLERLAACCEDWGEDTAA